MKTKHLHLILLLMLFATPLAVFAQDWQTNLQKSKKIAQDENKKIVLVFSGSDWCTPCIKLEQNIWASDEFKAYAKDHFVMLRADFPRKKRNRLSKEQQEINNQLAEKYNPDGYFPLVVILDANGKVLGTTGYQNISPKAYISLINSF